jgi:hypothetical protein
MAMYLAVGRAFVKANFSGFCHRTAAGEGVDWL